VRTRDSGSEREPPFWTGITTSVRSAGDAQNGLSVSARQRRLASAVRFRRLLRPSTQGEHHGPIPAGMAAGRTRLLVRLWIADLGASGSNGQSQRRSLSIQHRNQALFLVFVTCKWLCLAFTYSGRFQAGKRIGTILLVSVPWRCGRSGRDCRGAPGGLDAVGIGFPLPDVVEVGLTLQRARSTRLRLASCFSVRYSGPTSVSGRKYPWCSPSCRSARHAWPNRRAGAHPKDRWPRIPSWRRMSRSDGCSLPASWRA
jgi:hypothetical protein